MNKRERRVSTVKCCDLSISDGRGLDCLRFRSRAATAVGLSCRGSEVQGAQEEGGG